MKKRIRIGFLVSIILNLTIPLTLHFQIWGNYEWIAVIILFISIAFFVSYVDIIVSYLLKNKRLEKKE